MENIQLNLLQGEDLMTEEDIKYQNQCDSNIRGEIFHAVLSLPECTFDYADDIILTIYFDLDEKITIKTYDKWLLKLLARVQGEK